jgi:hypothetical protein
MLSSSNDDPMRRKKRERNRGRKRLETKSLGEK